MVSMVGCTLVLETKGSQSPAKNQLKRPGSVYRQVPPTLRDSNQYSGDYVKSRGKSSTY